MAKQRSRIDKDRLADITSIDKSIEEITGQKGKSFSIADTKPPKERTPGLTAKGRVKLTTMIKPELRDMIQAVADNNAISLADVLETILLEYFDIKQWPGQKGWKITFFARDDVTAVLAVNDIPKDPHALL